MPFSMENPAALALLLILPGIYLLGRARLSLMSTWRARIVLALRLASLGAIALALAGPSMPLRDGTMSVAFVLDESASLAPATRARGEAWVRQAIDRMKASDRSAVVRFAGDTRVVKPLSNEKGFQSAVGAGVNDSTNLSGALKIASGLLPASGLRKVVVLSDGWDTAGRVEEALRSLPAGTRVDVVPWPAMEGQQEVLIESLDVPSYVREGDGLDLSAVVGASHEGSAQLRVLVDGAQTAGWTVQLGAGANLVTLSERPLPPGYHSVEVRLDAEVDTLASNNAASGFVVVKEKGHVLLVEGSAGGGGSLRRQLEGSGLQVDRILVSELAMQLPRLSSFDSVVLDNVSGPSLSLDQMKALQSYVRDQGRGLLVIGGSNSFGLGDYASLPLEEMLPVSSNVPLTKERGDVALILVIDRSGSMDEESAGVSKIAMAREAAAQATEVLKPGDTLGVIAFDTDPKWIVPVQKVGNNLAEIRSRISSLQASGGTDIFGALQVAFAAMAGVQATTRHITLLTDGQSWKGPYQALLQRMKSSRITLSSIAVGDDADTDWLSELARLGDGRYYFTQRFSDVPKIVLREVTAATKVAEVNGTVDPVFVAPSPILRGMSREGIPSLSGYVATKPKDAATVVLRSARGDPLLSQWQYGLGRVVAWTSDAEGLWSANWVAQPQFSRVWDQAVRWAMAPPIDRGLQIAARVEGARAIITAQSVDQNGEFVDLADTRAEVSRSDGNREVVQLLQTGPGRYEATVSVSRPGPYRVRVHQAYVGQPARSETSGFSVPASPEFRQLGSNDALLKAMASSTGGRSLADPAEAFSRRGMPSSPGWEPLWPYLLALALLLLPLEVAARRIRSLPFRRREDTPAPPEPTSFPVPSSRGDQERIRTG